MCFFAKFGKISGAANARSGHCAASGSGFTTNSQTMLHWNANFRNEVFNLDSIPMLIYSIFSFAVYHRGPERRSDVPARTGLFYGEFNAYAIFFSTVLLSLFCYYMGCKVFFFYVILLLMNFGFCCSFEEFLIRTKVHIIIYWAQLNFHGLRILHLFSLLTF